jgi:hypothetical protein
VEDASFFCIFAWLALGPEDGADMFLLNIILSPNYTALQSKRL